MAMCTNMHAWRVLICRAFVPFVPLVHVVPLAPARTPHFTVPALCMPCGAARSSRMCRPAGQAETCLPPSSYVAAICAWAALRPPVLHVPLPGSGTCAPASAPTCSTHLSCSFAAAMTVCTDQLPSDRLNCILCCQGLGRAHLQVHQRAQHTYHAASQQQ